MTAHSAEQRSLQVVDASALCVAVVAWPADALGRLAQFIGARRLGGLKQRQGNDGVMRRFDDVVSLVLRYFIQALVALVSFEFADVAPVAQHIADGADLPGHLAPRVGNLVGLQPIAHRKAERLAI